MAVAIPTIDISRLLEPNARCDDVIAEIGDACGESGFLVTTGTGIDAGLVARMRRTVERIFAVDARDKEAQRITRDNYRGYIPLGFFRANGTHAAADAYEGYKLHQEMAPGDPICGECRLYGPNRWPAQVPEARQIILAYWSEMDRISRSLIGALEQYLQLPTGAIGQCFHKPLTNMTLLHYPPGPDCSRYGIHPHKDTDALTIIAHEPVGGLEAKSREGQWLEPKSSEGEFIVNIGDMLELWSGGRLLSTPHRVINRSDRSRYSFPYFAVPRYDVVIEPLLPPRSGFDRPAVHCGHWSAEVWRTNWCDEFVKEDTPQLGTLAS